MDMSQYRDLFVSEAREHLRQMNVITLQMETVPAGQDHIAALFRHSHSLKGMAATMGYDAMAELAHRMEDLMDHVRRQEVRFTPGCADLMLEGTDLLAVLVEDVAAGVPAQRPVEDLVRRLTIFPGEDQSPAVPSVPDERPGVAEPGRPSAPAGDAGQVDTSGGQTVRIASGLLDRLVTVTGELVMLKHRLSNLDSGREAGGISEAVNELSVLLRELQGLVMDARMMPFGGITGVLPRLVRDLARRSGKVIGLELLGTEIGLDRAVLEALGEPLVHIVRNAVDHGIEPPDVRIAAGKPARGSIRIHASREKESVVISIADDGTGMDPDRIAAAAVAQGLVQPDAAAALTAAEALMLTCMPGFSTAATVTEVSGRGVGMDAVNALIRSFGGTLTIESQAGRGTSIILRVPRNIAIFNVLLVGCGPYTIGVPLSRIDRLMELPAGYLASQSGGHTVPYEEGDIPLQDLNELLGLPGRGASDRPVPVVVTALRGRTVGLMADRFSGQLEVFVRPLGRPLASLGGLSGNALLGDGSSLFILDVNHLA